MHYLDSDSDDQNDYNYLERDRSNSSRKHGQLTSRRQQQQHNWQAEIIGETSPLDDAVISEKITNLRNKTKVMTNFFLDDCDAIKERSRSKDHKTLEQIDEILRNTTIRPRFTPCRRTVSARDYLSTNGRSKMFYTSSPYKADGEDLEGDLMTDMLDQKAAIPKSDNNTKVRERMRLVEEHLEGILDYELPSVNNFKSIRSILDGINDKMAKHRSLVDKYTGLDLKEVDETCEERITRKYDELVERNPTLVSSAKYKTQADSKFDSAQIPGYLTGTNVLENESNAELRKRIRSLICRTRGSSVNPEPIRA